jgi:tetratricopeptide (TPR) repeat protein
MVAVTQGGLVGRESARASLCRAVDDAVAGRGRFTSVVGEAGIGKTALVAEVADYAVERGMGLLWATCWDGDGAPPYWPWVQVLRAYDERYGQQPTGVSDGAGGATTMLALAAQLSGRPAAAPGDGARERFTLFDAVSSSLVRAALVRPLLIVLDDLQWADVPSLLLLNFLARQVVAAPLAVVGAFRDDEVGADEALRLLLAKARGNGDVVALTGLVTADVERLMRLVAGASPQADLAADVSRRTGGNPFFVREVTQLLLSRGGLGENASGVRGIPDGVRQVVAQRLARLPQTCVSILEVAAVAGQETGIDVLVRVCDADVDTLTARLDEAVRSRVMASPSGPAGPYRFAHDLFRETLYDGLTPSVRAGLHLRVARALRASQAHGSVVHAAELAHHLLLAAAGRPDLPDLVDESVRYGVLAAGDAIAGLAYEDAVAHIQRHLDLLGPAGLLRASVRLDLLLCRAEALRLAGDTSAAREDYRQAVDLARVSPQPTELSRAALGIHALGVESGASRAETIELLEEALDRLSDEDSGTKARVLACLARELFLSGVGERVRAAHLSVAAVETARRVNDDAALAVCLLASHDTIWLPGTATRRRVIAVEMGVVARRAADRAFEAEACLLRASAALELGDPTALADLDEFVRLGLAVGQARFTYLALTRQATRATMIGRFAEAERLLDEAAALAERTGEPDAWNVYTRQLWELRTAQGRRIEAEAQLDTVRLAHLKYWYDALNGLILLERGQVAAAVRLIGSAIQTRPEELAFSYVLLAQWAEMGEAAAAAGLKEPCQRYYDTMLPFRGTAVVSAAAVGFDGAVDHHLGVLAAVLGRFDDAVGHLESAAVMHERLCAWPWLARTRCELAAVLVARGLPADRVRVTALLDEVCQAAGEFAMPGLARRAEEISLPPANVFRRDGDGWHISYLGTEIRLRDVKGLGDIATLLRAQGQAVPAASLAAGMSASPIASFDADPVLDQQARRQYRTRLAELDADIDAAEAGRDPARVGAWTGERSFLVRELSAAVGLGDRDRRLGDDRERARKAVAARIKDALGRIEAVHATLGEHLSQAISTGNLCAYRPAQPTRWQV